MNEVAEQLAEVGLGLDAEQFFKTELGQFIMGASEQDHKIALEQLSRVNPENTADIIKYQLKAASATGALEWLKEAIIRGRHAEFELNNIDSED